MELQPETATSDAPFWRGLLLVGGAAFLLAFVPAITSGYGLLMDEYYYLACADRLAAGYVDHPPLSVWLLALIRALFGDSVVALRIVPALSMSGVALLTGRLAWRLGGGRWAQLTSATAAVLVIPIAVFGTFYSMNALSVLFWIAGASTLVELDQKGDPRLWLLFGALAGLGAANKHPAAVFFAVTATAYCAFHPRSLRAPQLYGGALISILLIAPNLLWMWSHDWSTFEFYRMAEAKNVPTSPPVALGAQLSSMNPGSLPLLAGVVLFFRGGDFRRSGWIAMSTAALFLLMIFSGQSRPDRIISIYPILFAPAAVGWERVARRWVRRVARTLLPLLPLGVFGVIGPAVLPILPPAVIGAHAEWLGIIPEMEVQSRTSAVPPWIADRLGWESLAARVSEVARDLSEDRTAVIGTYYGISSSIEYFADEHPVPPVYGVHNSYHDWGPPPSDTDAFIMVGFDPEEVAADFADVESVESRVCDLCIGDRREPPITIAREPESPIPELWAELRLLK
jgi:4-amino-4-deoxy-L-arabinose transferase-like glycosyltransferase